jgi:hypothetical protein
MPMNGFIKYSIALLLVVSGLSMLAYRVMSDGIYAVAQCCLAVMIIFVAATLLRKN